MIGIIPCAGHATRLHELPKFLLPVPGGYLMQQLCQRMTDAGAHQLLIGVNSDNRALVDRYAPETAQVYTANTETMSQTVLRARAYAGDETVLFGMPDTYWSSYDVYEELLQNIEDSDGIASVAMWITPVQYRSKRGMVKFEDYRYFEHILQIVDKPQRTNLTCGWGAIVWKSEFWKYINPYDKHVGFALQRAIEAGEFISGKVFKGNFYDCGTPDEYFACIRETTGETLYATD